MTFGYDNKNDAHKLSNYNEWKKTAHIITEVEIKFETTGMTNEDAIKMHNCLSENIPFGLHDENDFVIVFPKEITLKQGETFVTYKTTKQLINAIKLLLFSFNKVYVPQRLQNKKLLDAPVRKKVRKKR